MLVIASVFVPSAMAPSVMAPSVMAQEPYPNRPVTVIVPFAAGGTSDVIARVVSEQMSRTLGQPLVIENIGGGGGTIALQRLARAAPDGYTIAVGNTGTNGAAYAIYPEIKYEPKDFQAIGLAARTLPVIAVKNDLAARTLTEFIALAKREPGKITIGHAGVGSSNYLICRQFLAAADIQVNLVSYRGAAPALKDVISGHLDGVCDNATSVASNVRSGTIRGLVVSSTQRLATLPDVATATEAGLPAFQAQGWNGYFTPKGLPAEVTAKLTDALAKALASDLVRTRFRELESTIPGENERSAAALEALVADDVARYRTLLGSDKR